MKVLLFSNDLMPFPGLPTSGGGLRCYQLMKGLESQGIEVIASMPGFTYLAKRFADRIQPEQRELFWDFGTQESVIRKVKPDALLFASNWDHYFLRSKPSMPLIIDLHGSRFLETKMWGQPIDLEKKISVLSKADCLLTAGKRQRLYFYGWLLQAGRVPKDEHFIRYIPISLSPEIPDHSYPTPQEGPRFVSGGGWFPWQNQAKTIFALCRAIDAQGKGSIEIFGTPHEKIGISLEEQAILKTFADVKMLADKNPRIRLQGYIGRDELLPIYCQTSVAVEAMEYNLERELAFTTRTIEYLWCGLPVLYNNFGEVSEHIKEYDAGWIINPSDENQIQKAIEEIFDDPFVVQRKGKRASSLVRDRFTWDKTIFPLVEYLRAPKEASAAEAVLGTFYSRPAFLRARGASVGIPVPGDGSELRQHFLVPADALAGVEIPVMLSTQHAREKIRQVELTLYRSSGKILRRKQFSSENLSPQGSLYLSFPLLRPPSGGTELVFGLRLVLCSKKNCATPERFQEKKESMPMSLSAHQEDATPRDTDSESPLFVRALRELRYPFLQASNSPLFPFYSGDGAYSAQALALSFVPAEFTRLYRVKVLALRAWQMFRQGEVKRIVRAVRRRIPSVIERVQKRLLKIQVS